MDDSGIYQQAVSAPAGPGLYRQLDPQLHTGDQRFADYDEVESLVFGKALVSGMPALAEVFEGEIVPSRAFAEGGIHEAIMEYENNVFFDILAEDLAVGTWMMSHRREQLCRAHQPDRRLHHRVRGAWH